MADYVVYDVTVDLLTPLHIGSGRILLHEYDYVIHGNRTWRLNEDALLEAQVVDDPALADVLAQRPPAELLSPADFKEDSPFFRYVLRGRPRAQGEGAELREQLKDPYDRPYLPGSTVKGALRTAIARYAWGEMGLRPDVRELGRKRQWAARSYERRIFGPDPNHDLMRALHVGDSEPVGTDRLAVFNVQVFNRGGASEGPPIEVEGIQPKTVFTLTVKVDLALFSRWAQKHGLRLNGEKWLERLPQVVQASSRALMEREVDWLRKMPNMASAVSLYRKLLSLNLPPYRCPLPLGWGTGWPSKTFGFHLQEDQRFMAHIIHTYRLTKGRWEEGDPFPKSRRMAVVPRRTQDKKRIITTPLPMGWVMLTFRKR